jgi:hypothetical protein
VTLCAPQFADVAREAYASGWAATGGPMTDRVRAGCVAAVALACEHHDSPGVLEATLRLGELEGTWAAVYQRREQLYADHTTLIMTAWVALVSTLDVSVVVSDFRRRIGVDVATEAVQDDTDRRAEAVAAVAALLALLWRDPFDRSYLDLANAVGQALADASAEGTAGAYAIAAEQLGATGMDFDLAFNDAYDALSKLDGGAAAAAVVIRQVIAFTTADLARLLDRLAGEGASHDDMTTAAADLLGGDNQRGVSVAVDLAMGAAFTAAATDLFTIHGARQVDFVTAGDGRVCQLCQSAEDGGPYDIGSAPAPPLHGFCRCTTVPTSPLTTLNIVRYLLGGTS